VLDELSKLDKRSTPGKYGSGADCYYDGITFPFKDESFDSLVANEVFEHVNDPDHFLDEAYRVLATGGSVFMTIPFVWDEHEQPNDFFRYTSFGIRHMLETHHFEVLVQRKSVNDIRVIFQLINAYIYKITVSRQVWVNTLVATVLMSPSSNTDLDM